MEKLYSFKLYRVDDDVCVYESQNIKYYKIKELIDAYWDFFLRDYFYYKIKEVGTVTYI